MRKYDATTRRAAAERTRERICAGAEKLFLRDGYARTSIRAVARTAGVAEATVYLAFANKAALLDAVIIRATRDAPALDLDGPDLLPRFAAAHAALMARAARLIALGEGASLMDADLRPLRERAHGNLRAWLRTLAERLDAPEAADTLYAIVSETTYLRMTEDAGLPPDRYAQWLTATLSALLEEAPDGPQRAR